MRRDRLLILSEPEDPVAAWVHERLAARGLSADLVTSEALCLGAVWVHTLGHAGTSFRITLQDGRRIQSDEVRGVLNRLVRVPDRYLVTATASDCAYAEQEWRALICSALHALSLGGATVVERPDPHVLSGRWRSPAEWALLAARSGLRVSPWRWHEEAPEEWPSIGTHAWALILGEDVLSDAALPQEARSACRKLVALAEVSLLQVGLDLQDAVGPRFLGVQTMPDLRLGGERALDALVQRFGA